MHSVHGRVSEQFVVVAVPLLNAKFVTDFIEIFGVTLANGVHVRGRMSLVDWNKFGPETEANDGDVYHKE